MSPEGLNLRIDPVRKVLTDAGPALAAASADAELIVVS